LVKVADFGTHTVLNSATLSAAAPRTHPYPAAIDFRRSYHAR
jgi:hypothetical protein